MSSAKISGGSVVNANFRMAVERIVSNFMSDDTINEYVFPDSFLSAENNFVRKYVDQFDFKSILTNTGKV